MKQLLILLLSLTLCLGGLTACGTDKRDDAADNNSGSGSVIDPDGSLMDPEDDVRDNPSAPNASQPNGGSAGSDPSGNGSASMPEGALNNGTVGENPAASQDSDGARSGRTAAQRETLFRPASYRQMLRNAQVHDRDGNLRDGENGVTPGILH